MLEKGRPFSAWAFLWLALGIAADLPAADKTLARALQCLDFMQYDQAVNLLNPVLEKNPKAKGLRPLLAYAYYRLNRPERALMGLHQELALFPEDPGALILLSFVAYKQGKSEEAYQTALLFDGVLAKLEEKNKKDEIDDILREFFPNGGLPDYILGLLEKRKGNVSMAAEQFVRAKERGYPALDCQIQIIDMELSQGNWPGALAACGEGLDPELPLTPEFYVNHGFVPEIYVLQGYAHERMGDMEGALYCLKKAESMKPFEPFVLKNLGTLYLSQESFEEAVDIFKKVILITPQDFQARLLLEQAEQRRRQPFEERTTARELDIMAERDAGYRYIFHSDIKEVANKANVNALGLLKEGLLVDAASFLRQFTALCDLSPTLHYNLAQILNSLNLIGEALRHGMRAIELQKDYRDALDLMGNLCLKIRDLPRSVRYYEDAARIDPHDPLAHYNLGCAFNELGEAIKAEASWRTAIQNEGLVLEMSGPAKADGDPLKIQVQVVADPVSFPAAIALGQLYSKQGRRDEAYQSFIKAIQVKPKNPQPYFEAGRILFESGDISKAKEFFYKFLTLGGEEAKVKALLANK